PGFLEDLSTRLVLELTKNLEDGSEIPMEGFEDYPVTYIFPHGQEHATGMYIIDRHTDIHITSNNQLYMVETDVDLEDYRVITQHDLDNMQHHENYLEMLQYIAPVSGHISIPVKATQFSIYELTKMSILGIDINGDLGELEPDDFEIREYKQGVYTIHF